MAPKIALVTGGSRGLGRSTVINLAKRGVNSIFTYHSNEAEAKNVINAVSELGGRAIALRLDVGKAASFAEFASQVEKSAKELGADRIDYLVNNAGTGLHASFLETTEQQLDDMYNIHLKSTFFLTQKLVPHLVDGGKVINLSSGLARFSFPGSSAYGSMKGAIDVLTRYMAKELGSRKISVNSIAPGAIATDFSGGMVRDTPAVQTQIADMTALGRIGYPEDIGPLIASMLGDENGWINGQRIEASGGIFL